MYVALSPNYGLCKSAQKNNINNFVQIAHSDCLITTIILQVSQGSKRKMGSTGFYEPVHLGRYWSVTSRHWCVYLQYLDRVADVKKQRIMLYKLF